MPGFLIALFTGIHVLSCIALMVTILLQSGKGGGLAGAFGGGSSQTLFGGRGAASFLSRASTVLAIVFFITSLTLGLSASRQTAGRSSLIQDEARRKATQRPTGGQPVAPAPGGAGAPAGQPLAPSGQQAPGGLGAAPSTPTAPTTQPSTTQPPASGTGGGTGGN